MICIRPMAPFRDRDRGFSPLSTRITARIQCSETAKRLDASVTNAAKGSMDRALAGCVCGGAFPACAAPLDSINDADIATIHTNVPRDRKAAIVLAPVKVEALTRRPDGRP
jgi:hypothetical protein